MVLIQHIHHGYAPQHIQHILYIKQNYDTDFIDFMRQNAIIISILTYLSGYKNNSKNLTFAKELMDEFSIKSSELKKYL